MACSRRKGLPRMPGQSATHQTEILEFTEEVTMQIGEPLRTIVVEPLEVPVNNPQPEPAPQPEPEPEQVPANR
jgi:hypothetical protein